MTDSLKFGPEWLRNLSSEGNTGGAPKYQLAEHRYGREEMLALFDRNVRAPDPLVKLQGLYVEKTQIPMALLTMTEEEIRQWHKGINSDVVLRLNGKTVVGPPGGGVFRGRGGNILERGRGRLRGSGGFHYSRGLSYEEQSDGVKEGGPPERPFSRSLRSYDRTQTSERSWGERNGGDPGDWNGSTSPRKEYSSMKDFSGSSRNSTESWRRHRGADDDEGWRKSDKWGRSNSWRDEGDTAESGGLSKSTSRTSSWGRGWADEGLRGRSHDEDSLSVKRSHFVDEVPEWAMENPSESGGSFDASGAFHGGNYSDEEEDNVNSINLRHRLSDDADVRTKSKSPPRVKKTSRNDLSENNEDPEEAKIGAQEKDRKLSRSQTAQGNLTDSSKSTSHSLAKSQSSSNLKTTEHPSESNLALTKRTESQNFDRIRVQHQNFIDKNDTNKELSEAVDVNNLRKKEPAVEPNGVIEEVMKSETSAVLEAGVPNAKEKNSAFRKDKINNLTLNPGSRLVGAEIEHESSVNRQGSEEDMERMAEVVKDTVVKLFEDEEKPLVDIESDKWYYRDPQGPFKSSEMLEWFMNGYFQLSLLVRREQDELYVKLGDLMLKCGKVPFLPGVNLPVLKADTEIPQPPQPQQQPPPGPVPPQPHGLSQPDIFMQQYHQYQMLQKQFLLSQQLALNKLSQSEMWSTLSPVQQRNLVIQKLAMSQRPSLPVDQVPQVEKNSFSQLLAQMQQHQQNKMSMPEMQRDTKTVDPIRQLLQHMNVMQTTPPQPQPQPPMVNPMNPAGVVMNHHLNSQSHLNSVLANAAPNIGVEEPKVEDPIRSLLRQLGNQSNIMPPQAPAPSDSLWGAPGRTMLWPQANQPGPVTNAAGLPMWEIKTEQQILAEQQLRLDEERRQVELRKTKEEEKEAAQKQKELEEKRREEEKREEIKKMELKKLEEKMRIQKEKEMEKEEKKKAEELKKKQQEEAQRKKQEAAKKVQEAQKKKEEKERKKEEEREKKRLQEEGKKKVENEKKKKEEEQQRLKKKQEEEEEAAANAKKQEMLKRPMEALKKMQDQQMEPFKRPLPWCQTPVTAPGTSLSEIQKMQEREKKQMLREQQMALQKAQEKEIQQMQKESESQSNGLNLKWAEQLPKMNPSVKSLAEIQAEEQLQLAKQLERERLERAQQQREAALTTNAGIWGNASQSLTWTNNSAPWGVTPVQNNPTPGFWDEVASNTTKSKAKTPSSPVKGKNQAALPSQKTEKNSPAQKGSKPKSKKEEAAVMKLFERADDEFTTWCSASLQSIQSDVDIPTFVSFLRDIESPYEVTEYVKCYLGDGKEAQEFAKQFLERRSRWMSSQKNAGDDDRNSKYSGVNSGSQYQINVAQEFQEVKGKGKKSKKGKMLKVDNRILGFSVTAAPDRINVGDRDYVNHNL
ncbi:hypothetical protein RUM43_013017 [Polyplax serrata]|uniref:GYF domain-containing protein n=1 Tax=Polyplax serrata TaxID=468196 RepID=A0AAN8P271_POLSC